MAAMGMGKGFRALTYEVRLGTLRVPYLERRKLRND